MALVDVSIFSNAMISIVESACIGSHCSLDPITSSRSGHFRSSAALDDGQGTAGIEPRGCRAWLMGPFAARARQQKIAANQCKDFAACLIRAVQSRWLVLLPIEIRNPYRVVYDCFDPSPEICHTPSGSGIVCRRNANVCTFTKILRCVE